MKTKKIPVETVKKQYEAWNSQYEQNNMRGSNVILFAQAGEQWKSDVYSSRALANKETLTFNACLKHSRKIKSETKQIEFSLNLAPVNTEYEDVEETNAFRMLLSHLLLSEEATKTYEYALDKCIDYGYSFIENNFKYEDSKTLCSRPTMIVHENPAIGFWDKTALSPFKTDGRFCGTRKMVTKNELMDKDPKILKKLELKEKDNEIIDYWWREYDTVNYIKLNTGIYKREDLITDKERNSGIIEIDANFMPIMEKGSVSRIMFARYCNEHCMLDPMEFPTEDLPLVYHPALTIWTSNGYMTFPFAYPLIGAQKLHNFINSQIATLAKNSTGDKWLFNQNHIQTEDQQKSAKDINSREGGFIFGIDPNGLQIQHITATEIPMSMIQLSSITQQEIDNIGGALIDAQQTDNVVLSGKALDKITHNMSLLYAPIMATQINFINENARIQRQMIPRLYTENRTLVIKKQDGSGQAIQINQPMGSGKIKNNIKDIQDNFHYDITPGPTSVMQKENTLKALIAGYQIAPNTFQLTADIYAKCLETSYSDEIARRFAAELVDPYLIKYSQGEISLEQYQQYKNKVNQDNAQMAQQNPQVQSMLGLAEAEKQKAAAQQFDAETKRQKALADAMNNQNKLQIEMAKLMDEKQARERQQSIDAISKELEANNQIIEQLTNANSASSPTA